MDRKLVRDKELRREVRKFRIHKKIKGSNERPRLVFNKTLKYLYAQLINDSKGITIKGFSTISKDLNIETTNRKNIISAKILGEFVGAKLKELGVDKIVFDRNGYLYHGKVKIFADAVRSKGIQF